MRKFEDLRIWKDARVLVLDIYKIMKDNKDYGFKDQIQRAAVSIMNNIAEGCDSGSDNLFIRYLKIARASSGEVNSMLYLCEDLQYIEKDKIKELQDKIYTLSAGIQSLIHYLKISTKKPLVS